MPTSAISYREQVIAELESVPDEYLPYVAQMIRSFSEGVRLKPAAASFRQGWQEALKGETLPFLTLWDGIDDAE